MSEKKAFVSHSHSDKAIAERLARVLLNQGIDAWLDKWEIQPGDSLVQKIFEEGLKECSAFLVLLSRQSVASAWVKHELDVALVKRLEGAARVIPVIVEQCEIPFALRSLLWVDLTQNFDAEARRIADVIAGRLEKPPVRSQPSRLVLNVPDLTEHAASLALFLSRSIESPAGWPPSFRGPTLAQELGLSAEQVSDAVEELETHGLVKLDKPAGTAPFTFEFATATYALALHLKGTGALAFDPEQDVLTVAAAVAAMGSAGGRLLQEKTGLSPSRINNAVAYLKASDLTAVDGAFGTAPFTFYRVRATSSTRRFTAQNAR
jgi:hypothetical protein